MGDTVIRETLVRCIAQNNDNIKNKYPLTVINATTTYQYPFQTPTADIEIVSSSRKGVSGYKIPIFSDDFVRLQVSQRMNFTSNWTIWQDIFVGQIQSVSPTFGQKNSITLHCAGMIDEATWTAIKEDKTWSSSVDAQTVFQYFISTKGYHRYLTYDSSYCLSGATVPSYNSSLNQTNLSDVITSMEEQSGYLYRASTTTIFDSNSNVDTVYFTWRPLSTVTTDKYVIDERTSRYISSDFSSSLEELRNREVVIGASSVSGSASDSGSIASYGERTRVDTLNSITSTYQCNNKASKIVNYSKLPAIYGSATLILTPEARPGDLVPCYVPSQEVDGGIVNTVLPVYRVRHSIANNAATTSVDVGRLNKDAYDYLGLISRNVKILNNNIVYASH